MYNFKKWLFKPKEEDARPLAQFFRADDAMTLVTRDLGAFDGRRDPERCKAVVTRMRIAQCTLLSSVESVMAATARGHVTPRHFRLKYPEELKMAAAATASSFHEEGRSETPLLPGFVWFAAECIASESLIQNSRHWENYSSLVPVAKSLLTIIELSRKCLRKQALENMDVYSEKVITSLRILDRVFAKFEFSYISAVVPVKCAHEYETQQEIAFLFHQALERGLDRNYISVDQIELYDPLVMFAIPRLAIIYGLKYMKDGPLDVDKDSAQLSVMFRPFQSLLKRIRDLLKVCYLCEVSMPYAFLCCDHRLLMINVKLKRVHLTGLRAVDLNGLESDLCQTTTPHRYGPPRSHPLNESRHKHVTLKRTNGRQRSFKPGAKRGKRRKVFKKGKFLKIFRNTMVNIMPRTKKENVKDDLTQRLFVCIAGVADQLQTNFASDIRAILKTVFEMYANASPSHIQPEIKPLLTESKQNSGLIHIKTEENGDDVGKESERVSNGNKLDDCTREELSPDHCYEAVNITFNPAFPEQPNRPFVELADAATTGTCPHIGGPANQNESSTIQDDTEHHDRSLGASDTLRQNDLPRNKNCQNLCPPVWIPDESSICCRICECPFNIIRRRHHCRNCGHIFCYKCCSNYKALPHYGYQSPVRTCTPCFNLT